MTNIIILFFVFALLIGLIFLQIYLSKRKERWFGLILPFITFLYSLWMIFNIAVHDEVSGGEKFLVLASTFLSSNIPTITLLGIYFWCREKRKVRSQLDKMNIQDLD